MVFSTKITGDRWMGEALVSWSYFPPNVNKMNSYAIHGSGEKRTYEALYPIPKEEIVEGQQPNLWVYSCFRLGTQTVFIVNYCFVSNECSSTVLPHVHKLGNLSQAYIKMENSVSWISHDASPLHFFLDWKTGKLYDISIIFSDLIRL